MKCYITILICLSILQRPVSPKNLLQNILSLNKAPDLRSFKKHIGYIEDTYLNFTELTTKYGYPSEEHVVTTEDGYILTIYRILSKCSEVKRYPVLLKHGIIDTSDGWIIPDPKHALGYILANNCYDVWALNNRGNIYSRKHIRLDPDRDPEYWNFSFEESGYYDVSAIIDYVLMVTKKKKVFYIGHSQGSTDFLCLGSLRPEYNDKLQLSILLAPVAWMNNIRSPIPIVAAKYRDSISDILQTAGFARLTSENEYIPHEMLEFICQIAPLEVCGTLGYIFLGDVIGVIPPRTLSVLYGHILVGVSSKTVYHYGQVIASKRFQRFDGGKESNLKKYGTIKPPQYNVTRITSPIVLIGSKHDWLSDLKDIRILESKLPNLLETYIVKDPKWSHNSHLWGFKAPEYVFSKILKYFDKFSSR